MPDFYKLVNRVPVAIEGELRDAVLEWGKFRQDRANLRVAETLLDQDGVMIHISTVFLGIDHGFGGGPPVLFETMIFGGKHDQYQERCCTWAEAEAMHARAVFLVNESTAA